MKAAVLLQHRKPGPLGKKVRRPSLAEWVESKNEFKALSDYSGKNVEYLKSRGTDAIFGPGSDTRLIVETIIQALSSGRPRPRE